MLSLSFISLAFILTLSSASHLCSSLSNPSNLSPQNLALYSQGCVIFAHQEDFHIEVPLLLENPSQNLIASMVDHNGEIAQFIIQKDHQNPSQYILKSISSEITQQYTIPQTHNSPLSLRIHAGLFSLRLQNSPFEISHALRSSSQYTLTIKTSPIKPAKPHSPRFLFSCPNDYFLVEDACVKICPSSHYGEDGVCKECSDTCGDAKCLSSTRCNPCGKHQFYIKEADTCLPQCPETYFHDSNNKICVKCAEGCLTCSSPDGLCSTNYFKTATLVNLLFSALLFLLIALCTCCLNKSKNRQENSQPISIEPISQQPGQEDQEIKMKVHGEMPQIIIEKIEKPKGPYVVLYEDAEGQEANEELDEELQVKTRRKRLSNVARSRLLSLSMSKLFIIDDGNEEKAISHDSSSKLHGNSPTLPNSHIDSSPGGQNRRQSHKRTTLLDRNEASKLFLKSLILGEDQQLSRNFPCNNSTDASPKISFGEASPASHKNYLLGESPSPINAGFIRREVSFGTMIRQHEQAEKGQKGGSAGAVEPVPVEEKEEELEFSRKMSNFEEENKGYKQDLSTSVSQDRDGMFDQTACSICGLNKKDCINRPCGHLVACFPCMKQFQESYGLCPKCKRLLNDIEKTDV